MPGRPARRACATGCGAAGIDRLFAHQNEALGEAGQGNVIVDLGHRLGQVALVQPAGARAARRRPQGARALPLSDQGARPGPGAEALRRSACPTCATRSTTATPRARTGPALRRRSNLILTNPDMLNMGVLPHHKGWGDFLTNLEWVVVDEAHTYRGVFGSHVANVLRRLRRVCRLYRAEPRFVLASATIANPGELAERLVGEPVAVVDSDTAPRAGPADRDVEPAADRGANAAAPLAAVGGRRAPRRPRLRGDADDLLPALAQGDRADPALRPDAARGARAGGPRGADRAVPRRLHAAAAPRDRGTPRRRRAPRRRRHRRARARDRHRRARRLDLRHVPRHRREPAADVGTRGAADGGARRLHRGRRRARPVLLPPSRGVPGAPRSRRRSWTTRTSGSRPRTCSRPRTRRRSAGPQSQPGGADDEILGEGWRDRADDAGRRRRAAAQLGPAATCRAGPGSRRARSRCARPRSIRSRSSTRPRARCSGRSRPSARSARSTRERSTCTWGAPTRCASSTSRCGGRSSSRSTATGTRSRRRRRWSSSRRWARAPGRSACTPASSSSSATYP